MSDVIQSLERVVFDIGERYYKGQRTKRRWLKTFHPLSAYTNTKYYFIIKMCSKILSD